MPLNAPDETSTMLKMEFTPEDEGGRLGERIVFAAWAGVIALGLVTMIVIPIVEMAS